ncbi:MAG: VOC family protein [Acidimicrobiia bacterium]
MYFERHAPGSPSWVDLGTSDLKSAARFYGAMFGWETTVPVAVGTNGYRMFTHHGRVVAGLGTQMNPGPPWWTTYVTVANLDETIAATVTSGGAVTAPPFDIVEAGRMAVLRDVCGAAIAVWEPHGHEGAELMYEPDAPCWFELACRDADAARCFYRKAFGWESVVHVGGKNSYTEFSANGQTVAGLIEMDRNWPASVPAHWMVYFGVEDCDAAAQRCLDLGGSVAVAPTDIPAGRFAVLNDPAGAAFSIIRLVG